MPGVDVFAGWSAAREGELRVKRQEWIDEFLAKYRRGVMALKVLRWELEKTK